MDMRRRLAALVVLVLGIGAIGAPRAATITTPVNVSVVLGARAKLTIGTSTLSFANADPDTTPTIPATEGTFSVTAGAITSTGSAVTLTVVAADDLRTAGGASIPISNVNWTSTGAGFQNGSLNRTTAQAVAAWSGSGSRTGTQSYGLVNSWAYATGTYTTSATYTLTAP
jgi:hypothetical protein